MALVQSEVTRPGVSAPSRVVRSTIEMARSIAASLVERLIDLVASFAARASAPTASTPLRDIKIAVSCASDSMRAMEFVSATLTP
jgi:hypothetical protein